MIGPGEQQGAVPGGSESAPVDMRIGDTERNLVVERLQSALGEGRLDITEFDERLAAVYAARTVGDLQPLTADLPAATRPLRRRSRWTRPPRPGGTGSASGTATSMHATGRVAAGTATSTAVVGLRRVVVLGLAGVGDRGRGQPGDLAGGVADQR